MTILSALQPAMIRLVGRRPSTIFGTTNTTELQLADLANEVATDIMKGYDWQALTEIYTVTGDGVASAFPFPEDYDRMVQATEAYNPENWAWGYCHISSVGDWVKHVNHGVRLTPGAWMIRKNQFHFDPAPTEGQTAEFAYISNHFARSKPAVNTGAVTPRSYFETDDDTFVLSERLITLGVIWRYREQKGMGYTEDLANYETALSQEQARDKGARVIRSRARYVANTHVGWPYPLGGV